MASIQNKKSKSLTLRTLKHIAKTLAQSLDDEDNLTLYQHYCETYPLKIIDKAFDKAKNTPIKKIKKNRAAIFFFFINVYAKENQNDSCH